MCTARLGEIRVDGRGLLEHGVSSNARRFDLPCEPELRVEGCLAHLNAGVCKDGQRLAKKLSAGVELDRVAAGGAQTPLPFPSNAAGTVVEVPHEPMVAGRGGRRLRRHDPFGRDRELCQVDRLYRVSAAEPVNDRSARIGDGYLDRPREISRQRIIDDRARRRVGCKGLILGHGCAGERRLVQPIGRSLREEMNGREPRCPQGRAAERCRPARRSRVHG